MNDLADNPEAKPDTSAFLEVYEKILKVLLIGLAGFHMWITAFQYVINMKMIKKAEPTAALGIAGLIVLYVIISIIFYPQNVKNIRYFIQRIFTYDQFFLIFLAVWFVISCFVNEKHTGSVCFNEKNRWDIFDAFVNALVLFPMAKILTKTKARKIIELGLMIVLFSYSVFSVYGLWQLFHLNFIKMPSGFSILIRKPLLAIQFGIHYNITGAIAFLMLVLCLYFMTHQNTAVRIISFLLFPIHLFVCHLSNSRTIFATGLIIISAFMFLYFWNRYDQKDLRFRIFISLIAAGIGFCLYRLSRPVSFIIFEKLTHYSEISLGVEDGVARSLESIRVNNNLNGRGSIWLASMKLMLHDPFTFLFGVTPTGVTSALIDLGGLRGEYSHAHNIAFQIGVCLGIPAMIGYCVFLFRLCIRSLLILFTGKRSEFSTMFVIPILIFSFIIPGTVEIHIARCSIMTSVFTLVSGWVFELFHGDSIKLAIREIPFLHDTIRK